MAARARSAPLGRKTWPLEPARLCWGARSSADRARSAPLGHSTWPLEPARLRWGTRDCRSSPLASAGALDMVARAHSAPLGRSSPLGCAGALEMAVRACSAPLGRWTWPLEPARLRWGARHGRSSPLGSAGALDRTEPNENEPNRTGQAYPETLHWAGPRMLVVLSAETNILVHGMHGYALVYIYIYMY